MPIVVTTNTNIPTATKTKQVRTTDPTMQIGAERNYIRIVMIVMEMRIMDWMAKVGVDMIHAKKTEVERNQQT